MCTACGSVQSKWHGKCPDCGEWGSLEAQAERTAPAPFLKNKKSGTHVAAHAADFVSLEQTSDVTPRFNTGISELDRALGGGMVEGGAVLLGGQPGIGKSTLLSQTIARIATEEAPAVYVSGEESSEQVRLRFQRLSLPAAHVRFLPESALETVLGTLEARAPHAKLLVIDSIQTLFSENIPSAPGTVTQVRACADTLVRFCKKRGLALIIVGHVTKDGQIAGPKLLEHMVDTVLYFEGEDRSHLRIVRAVKNRFGAAGETAFFDMRADGLHEVKNPSAAFLSGYNSGAPGVAVCASMEGTRPVLVEVQALVAQSHMATPRRAAVGWTSDRLAMLLAVLQVRCGISLADKEIFLNIAGGMKISEPAADIAAAAALLSAFYNRPPPEATVFFGEAGLSGEIRQAPHAGARIKEATKLGFVNIVCPTFSKTGRERLKQATKGGPDAKCAELRSVQDLAALFTS